MRRVGSFWPRTWRLRTEEIAVFRAFTRAVDRVKDGFVVMDTVPTEHTLLLLDNTRSYHREAERGAGEVPQEVRRLLSSLRDPEWSHVILVTLAQTTPVLEAARLQDDLRRAGGQPNLAEFLRPIRSWRVWRGLRSPG